MASQGWLRLPRRIFFFLRIPYEEHEHGARLCGRGSEETGRDDGGTVEYAVCKPTLVIGGGEVLKEFGPSGRVSASAYAHMRIWYASVYPLFLSHRK